MLQTLALKQTSLPSSRSIWANLIAHELRQRQAPDAVSVMQQSGLVPDRWQVAIARSQASRMLLLCCRQSGKSTTTAALALATALREPGSLVLLLSPSLRQSSELFRKVLDHYRTLTTPVPTSAESALRLELANGSRLVSLPGTEGTVRGYAGVSLLVIDEAARVQDELYYAVRPMLAISHGRLIALSTPFGKRGWLYKEYTEGESWERVKITAYDCPRISKTFLDEEARTLPPLWFQSEYMCEFVDLIGQVFASEFVYGAISAEVQPLF
jgi:Terminase large subunit, T4likevirus-type, N-terminal